MNRIISIFIITAILISAIYSKDEKNTTDDPLALNIGNFTDIQSLELGKKLYYNITLPQNIDPNVNDLIIDLTPYDNIYFEHDIFVSDNSSSTYKLRCYKANEDTICFMPRTLVNPNNTISINLHCKDRVCKYRFAILLSYRSIINEGIPKIETTYVQNETRVFEFNLTSNLTADEELDTDLSLTGKIPSKAYLVMFVGKPKQDDTDFEPVTYKPSKAKKGLKVRIATSDKPMCSECKYMAVALFKEPTSYQFSYKRRTKGIQIIEDKNVTRITDVLTSDGEKNRNCYKMKVKDPKNSLTILMKPYGMKSVIAVDSETVPDDRAVFEYLTLGNDFTERNNYITLSGRERIISGYYYLCVYGDILDTTYDMIIGTEKPTTLRRLQMDPTIARTLYLSGKELTIFEYKVDGVNTQVEAAIKSTNPNTTYFLANCTNNETTGTKCDSINSLEGFNSSNILTFTGGSLDLILPLTDYGYLIGVYSEAKTTLHAKLYSIDQNAVQLTELVPFFGSVQANEKSRFKFSVSDQVNATYVKIDLEFLEGDCPFKVKKGEQVKTADLGISRSIIFDTASGDFLPGQYDVIIGEGLPSTFTLTYSTSNIPNIPVVGLVNGIKKNITLDENTNSLNYAFGVSQKLSLNPNLKLTFVPISGSFNLYVDIDKIPNESNYTWSKTYNAPIYISNGSRLLLDSSSDSFIMRSTDFKSGTYNIFLAKTNASDNSTPYAYSIEYDTGITLPTLQLGSNEAAIIGLNETIFYKFDMPDDLTSIIEFKTLTVVGSPQIYVSLTPLNKLPSADQYDYYSQNTDTVKVPVQTVYDKNPTICNSIGSIDNDCSIYVGVYCNAPKCSFGFEVSASAPQPSPEPAKKDGTWWTSENIQLYSIFYEGII